MSRLASIIVILLLAGSVFAQRNPTEAFLSREYPTHFSSASLRDHPWQQRYESRRFVLLYDQSQAPISQSAAQTALNNLEEIFDVFVYDEGFRHPYEGRAANQRYKMCVYVLRPGEGHAFGGTTGSPNGPGMWLSAGAVSDRWALAHEFMHGLQAMTSGMGGGNTNQGTNFRGWFYESHANLMPHLVYPGRSGDAENGLHYCTELYTRHAHLYLGSTRNRYCNWPFFEYVVHKRGTKAINDMWTATGFTNHDPFEVMMRQQNLTQAQFSDWFGEFAMRAVIWELNTVGPNNRSAHTGDYGTLRNSALWRARLNRSLGNPDERFKRQRYTYLHALEDYNPNSAAATANAGATGDVTNNRYMSPFDFSPQRYAFNIVRLYPEAGGNWSGGEVTVQFRGDVQTANNVTNYTKRLNLEPAVTYVHNNPGSDWRYGLVAVRGDAASTAAGVSARYSDMMRSSEDNPSVSITMQSGETQLYLVVAATPTVNHKINWDQFYHTVYRFPYMVQIDGAVPDGFQPPTAAGRTHSNGGGFVANNVTVPASVYVGPNARVLGGTVSGNARIEGRAVVRGGTVSGNAIVRDYAVIIGGTVTDRAIVSNGATVFNGQISGDARVHGNALIVHSGVRLSGNAQVGGVVLLDHATILSGTAQLLGDGEVYAFTASAGVFYGLVDNGLLTNTQHRYSEVQREFTKPRSTTWEIREEITTDIASAKAATKKANSFKMNSKGTFTYNFVDGVDNARLKMFDVRGKLVGTIPLNGKNGTVNTKTNAARMVFWRVETTDGKIIGKTGSGAVLK